MVKKSILWLHKWLGLIVGLIIFIVSITGCIYVFYDDLKTIVYPERYSIQENKMPVNKQALPLTDLIEIANNNLPTNEKVTRVDLYLDKDRTWIFRANKTDKEKTLYHNYMVYYKRVFINPYSGKVQFVENTKYEFFQVVLQLHQTLLLGKNVGHTIVALSTIIFIILIISGLVLWWPKKWKSKLVKKAVWVNFSVKWKRLVYDLHNVLGFQTFIFVLIIAFTGLIFSYPNFKKFTSKTLNSITISQNDKDLSLEKNVILNPNNILNESLLYVIEKNPEANMMSVRLRDKDEHQDVQVRLEKNKTSVFRWYYFDQNSGKLLNIKSSENQKLGDELIGMNYDLHTGGIWGYPTKILAFIVSLICASLPITGAIVWWNKKPKRR
ncbi:PepSY domain-containing protein [Empedobacter brevis]|uniref:PepSY-associated TM helix domain-containing protein n=1 Tax=Empedobacter brevis TaxID=247 RepID=UPI00123D261D|nr:PepSY-associated TM helix domain-containing protein [Empedobacter brevis]QES93952.1 PepSY domain-containing protein [Empedobacter brevis]